MSINFAIREVRNRLRAICHLAQQHLNEGGDFQAASLGDKFTRHVTDQEDIPWGFLDRQLRWSHPGLREFVRDRFVAELNSFLPELPEHMRTGVWGKLLQSAVCTRHFGISVPIAEYEHNDPVFKLLGGKNEFTRLFDDVALIAVGKLAEIGGIEPLSCLVCCIAEGTGYPVGAKALTVFMSCPEEARTAAITTAGNWHRAYKLPGPIGSAGYEEAARRLQEKTNRLKTLKTGDYDELS
jgi:hypothetical protein